MGLYEPVDGPVLAGSGIAWAPPLGGNGYRVVERVGSRDVVVRTARGSRGRTLTPTLSGSAEALAVEETLSVPDRAFGGVLETAFTTWGKLPGRGSLAALAMPCRQRTVCPAGIDVDGTRVLSAVGDPSDNSAAVRDLASGVLRQRVPGAGSSLSVAGGHAAWVTTDPTALSRRAFVVWDLAANRERYRVPFTGEAGGVVDVQADGKVAFIGASLRLAWASPAEPYAHPVSGAGRAYGDFVLRDNTLTWLRSYRGGRAIFSARLGSRPRLLVDGVKGSFDTDGVRVVWAGRSCRGAVAFTQAYGSLTRRASRRGSACPLRLASSPRLGKDGSITLRPNCAGFSKGCTLDVLSVRAARSYSAGGRRLKAGQEVARIPRAGSTGISVRVRLTRAARTVLARRSVRIRVRAELAGDRGTSETRSATFVLRR